MKMPGLFFYYKLICEKFVLTLNYIYFSNISHNYVNNR